MTHRSTLKALVQSCSDCTGISVYALMHKRATCRGDGIGYAKHAIWWIMYNDLGFSFPDIGRQFDVCHTTVVYAIGRCKKRPIPEARRVAVQRIARQIRDDLNIEEKPERLNNVKKIIPKMKIKFEPRPEPKNEFVGSNTEPEPALALLLRRGLPRYNAEKLLSRIRI